MKQILMGNEAIALGALASGVNFVSGYPGTPSSEIIETIIKQRAENVYVEWSVNEKTALESAAGASLTGARCLVTMKQVGLNVASDPIMSLNYIGIQGGVVIVAADDPGPISSQTLQDTRSFAQFAHLAFLDPATPEEAYQFVQEAFKLSEALGRPCLLRPTTRVCHSYSTVDVMKINDEQSVHLKQLNFVKDPARRVIFPKLTATQHPEILKGLRGLADSPFARFNQVSVIQTAKAVASPALGIAAGGVCRQYVKEALEMLDVNIKLLEVSLLPISTTLTDDFFTGLEKLLIIEDLDPVIENALIPAAVKNNVPIYGKHNSFTQNTGEHTPETVLKLIQTFAEVTPVKEPSLPNTDLPVRPPKLCPGCPHIFSFNAVKAALADKKTAYCGDIGCYTLGNALGVTDTCLCMGGGLGMAQGVAHMDRDTLAVAFIGDSTFFHSGLTGLVNAVFNQADIIVCILDNSTTAMTGGQTHPGLGVNAQGQQTFKPDIKKLCEAVGVNSIQTVNPYEIQEAKDAVKTAAKESGVRVIIFQGLCIKVRNANQFS